MPVSPVARVYTDDRPGPFPCLFPISASPEATLVFVCERYSHSPKRTASCSLPTIRGKALQGATVRRQQQYARNHQRQPTRGWQCDIETQIQRGNNLAATDATPGVAKEILCSRTTNGILAPSASLSATHSFWSSCSRLGGLITCTRHCPWMLDNPKIIQDLDNAGRQNINVLASLRPSCCIYTSPSIHLRLARPRPSSYSVLQPVLLLDVCCCDCSRLLVMLDFYWATRYYLHSISSPTVPPWALP